MPPSGDGCKPRCGYTITGSVKLDKWFLPNGEKGRNGKSTIFGAVASAVGEYTMEIDAATFDTRQQERHRTSRSCPANGSLTALKRATRRRCITNA